MGRHRATLRTPRAHRASRLIPPPSWPSRNFVGFMVCVLAVLAVCALSGAVRVAPVDSVAFVTSSGPVSAPEVGMGCFR